MPNFPEIEITPPPPDAISFAEFLENTPPNTRKIVGDLFRRPPFKLHLPEIQIHCSNSTCNGVRFYRIDRSEDIGIQLNSVQDIYLDYRCNNCLTSMKTFAIRIESGSFSDLHGTCLKLGELPAYGPPTPSRLIKLIGPDRELFLKGRSCENHGLGVGAFTYYRRVVENQKNRILDEILKVSKRISAPADKIKTLETAKEETQFSKSVKTIKGALPESLLVNGQNPLTLLYAALSDGLHDHTDEHCLELAGSIRVVLGELSERLALALKDEAELNHAVNKLIQIKSTK